MNPYPPPEHRVVAGRKVVAVQMRELRGARSICSYCTFNKSSRLDTSCGLLSECADAVFMEPEDFALWRLTGEAPHYPGTKPDQSTQPPTEESNP